MDVQGFLDAIGDGHRRVRSDYHLTLSQIIEQLKEIDDTKSVRLDYVDQAPGKAQSYRGYYSDLAFQPTDKKITVKNLLEECQQVLGATFEGYKGGDFKMDKQTPLWSSGWGTSSQRAIIRLKEETDRIIVETKYIAEM